MKDELKEREKNIRRRKKGGFGVVRGKLAKVVVSHLTGRGQEDMERKKVRKKPKNPLGRSLGGEEGRRKGTSRVH